VSASGPGIETDLKDWFRAFHGQSGRPAGLGTLELATPRALGGGRSGAQAAVFFTTDGPLVLKWDALDRVVRESEARRERVDQAPDMALLRDRGASHLAIRRDPATAVVFGIMAYPYYGPDGRGLRDDLVGDFSWFVREKYGNGWGDEPLRQIFDKLLLQRFGSFPVDDQQTPYPDRILALPDLAGWEAKQTRALGAAELGGAELGPGSPGTLRTLAEWAGKLTMTPLPKSAFDSRLIHGDPRFANIIVDLDLTRFDVVLIDFGAGASGGHLFRDLARFEVDLLLRTTDPGERDDELRARAAALFGHDTSGPSGPHVHLAQVWRAARSHQFSAFHREEVRRLHALFVSMELLRRIEWHLTLQADADSGATPAELVTALDALMDAVPA